jgi:hypothetical protein
VIEGGCFCGSLRYALDERSYRTANCHCTMCRRVHAAPFVTWLVVPTVSFRYTRGAAKVLRSSADGSRQFCADCGTHVACLLASHPESIDITLGSLDDPSRFTPEIDVYTDTQLPWTRHLTGDK